MMGDGSEHDSSEVSIGVPYCLKNKLIVFDREIDAATTVDFHEAFNAQVFQVDELTLVQSPESIDIKAFAFNRAQQITHDFFVGLVIGGEIFFHPEFPGNDFMSKCCCDWLGFPLLNSASAAVGGSLATPKIHFSFNVRSLSNFYTGICVKPVDYLPFRCN
jgi:hypothetical protein